MADSAPPFDVAAAHKYFAADCFNRTWSLIEKSPRSAEDDEAMLLAALASLWHWTQRADCTPQNLSIGHWQVARVYALVGQGEDALHHARRSLEFAAGLPPFFIGYAHEAIARAAAVLGDRPLRQLHLDAGREAAAVVDDAADRRALEADLATIA